MPVLDIALFESRDKWKIVAVLTTTYIRGKVFTWFLSVYFFNFKLQITEEIQDGALVHQEVEMLDLIKETSLIINTYDTEEFQARL